MFLPPRERTFCAIDADVQIVLLAAGNLRGIQNSPRAAVVADEQVRVVLKLATRFSGR
jgi:hypothetical protein